MAHGSEAHPGKGVTLDSRDGNAPIARSERRTTPRPRLQRMVSALTVGSVLLLGTIATLVGVVHERSQASQRDQQAADRAAARIADEVESTLNTLQGASSMAVDGEVTTAEFASYGEQALQATELPVLGLALAVPGTEREAFEQRYDLEIVDREGGRLVPAGARLQYVPVVDVVPDEPATTAVLGFDLSTDVTRWQAALEAAGERRPVVGEAVHRAADGSAGYVVIQALYAPAPDAPEELLGYVTSTLRVDDLVATAGDRLPDGTALALTDEGDTLAGDPSQGRSAEARGTDQAWTVTADHPDGPGIVLPSAIAAATLAVAGLLVFSARRDYRYEQANVVLTEQLAQDAAHDAVLALVARRLSFAPDSDAVIDIVTTDVARVTEAAYADVWFLHDREQLTVSPGRAPTGDDPLDPRDRVPLDAHQPAAEAVRERRIVVVDDLLDYQRDHPGLLAEAQASGSRTVAATPLFDSDGEPMGALTFVWREPGQVDDDVGSVIETLARLCGQTLRRTRLADRTAELAAIASRLAVTTSPASVTTRLTESAFHSLGATYVNVRFLEPESGVLLSVSEAGLPDDVAAAHADLAADSEFPSAECVRADAPVWVPDLDDWAGRFPSSLEVAHKSGFSALAALPVHDSRGDPVGAVTFAWDTAMRFDPELQAHVTTITDIAAQTLERARLASMHQRRAESLGRLAQTLATRVTAAGVADAVGAHVPALLGADRVAIAVVDTAGAAFDALAIPGQDQLGPVREHRAIVDAFRSGETALFPDAAAFRASYPELAGRDDQRGVEANAFLPLRDAQDRRLGVLTIGWSSTIVFDDERRTLLATLADLVGQTLERAMLHEGEHAVVATLQKRLLTPAPDMPGLDIAVHYEPASGDIGIGGDWYDTVPLDGEGVVVVVGDVTGHGVEAVAAMAQLQHLIAGLIRTGTPLDSVFSRANAMVAEDGIYATAILLHVDHRRRRLGFVSAGHPPALLRRPDGTVTVLSGARQPLIGVALEPRRLEYVDLPPGSLVLSYTDGLVERRSQVLSRAIRRLSDELAAVGAAGGPAPELLDKLVVSARAPDADSVALDDDVAAVLIRTER